MKTCSDCEAMSENLENWGQYALCKRCVKKYRDDFPETSTTDEVEIKFIPKLSNNGAAGYHPRLNSIIFFSVSEERTLEVINHEVMHWVLHKYRGLKTTYQYDNIHKTVDPFHDS